MEATNNAGNTEKMFISEDVLNFLKINVLEKINCLSLKVDPNVPLWSNAIRMCQRIEQNQLSLASVIFEARKDNKYFYSSATENPAHFHAELCRTYILLYYRHHEKDDEKLYQEAVFPLLRENMGVYASKYLEKINSGIDNFLSTEKLVTGPTKEEEKAHPLNPAKAHLFCKALLEYLGCKDIKYKTDVVPLANCLFGWSLKTMERSHSFDQDDRDVVAALFEIHAPEFASFISTFEKKTPKEEHIEKSLKAGTKNKKKE